VRALWDVCVGCWRWWSGVDESSAVMHRSAAGGGVTKRRDGQEKGCGRGLLVVSAGDGGRALSVGCRDEAMCTGLPVPSRPGPVCLSVWLAACASTSGWDGNLPDGRWRRHSRLFLGCVGFISRTAGSSTFLNLNVDTEIVDDLCYVFVRLAFCASMFNWTDAVVTRK